MVQNRLADNRARGENVSCVVVPLVVRGGAWVLPGSEEPGFQRVGEHLNNGFQACSLLSAQAGGIRTAVEVLPKLGILEKMGVHLTKIAHDGSHL
jgi:hypothetical protein